MNLLETIPPAKRRFLEQTGALLQGHFRLSSGLHSQYYFQCARLLQYPDITHEIAGQLAEPFSKDRIDVVISPAIGAIVLGFEAAKILRCRSLFTERVENKMALRRGFVLQPGEKVLIAEDVTTTGGSVVEIAKLVKETRGEVKGFCAIVDRSGGTFSPVEPFVSWIELPIETYPPEACPLCKNSIPIIYPGSRKST